MTSRESIPGLISLSATVRRTGSLRRGILAQPTPPTPPTSASLAAGRRSDPRDSLCGAEPPPSYPEVRT